MSTGTQTNDDDTKQDQDIGFSYRKDSKFDVSQQDNKSKLTEEQAIQTFEAKTDQHC